LKISKNNITQYSVFILTIILLSGCSKETQKKDYVARVNNEYLTEGQLNNLMDTSRTQFYYKNEIIRNWINQQLIYQEAAKEGITDNYEYKRLIEDSKKKLAVTLYINKLFKDKKFNVDNSRVENFYNSNKNEFSLFYDAYMINFIQFNNEEKAIKFRSTLLESGWNKATNGFKNDSSIVKIVSSKLSYDFEIQPAAVIRIIKELNQNEVSIVLSDSAGDYSLVQLVQKFKTGEVPPFEFIKSQVKKRLVAQMKDEFLKNYVNELYSNNDIEVKN